MKDLAKSIQNIAKSVAEGTWTSAQLKGAAERWAVISLSTFQDGLLDRALAISKAMAEFDAAMADPDLAGQRRRS